jgi:hypothetical protein
MKHLALILIGVLWCAESIAGTADARDFERDNSEYFSITDASQTGLDVSGHNDLYICFWVKFESVSVYIDLVDKYDNKIDQRSYAVGLNNSDNKLFFDVSSNGLSGGYKRVLSSSAVTTNTWYFIQAYHDPVNDLLAISINNGSFNTTAHNGGMYDGTAPFKIGAGQYDNVNYYFHDGLMQSVGFYSSIPSSDVRTSLYNSGIAKLHCQLTAAEKVGLVSYWNLDEQSGTAYDSHGSNDLTDNNTVLYGTGLASDICPSAGGKIKKINGVAWASVSKVSGVSKANISKIIGVDAS